MQTYINTKIERNIHSFTQFVHLWQKKIATDARIKIYKTNHQLQINPSVHLWQKVIPNIDISGFRETVQEAIDQLKEAVELYFEDNDEAKYFPVIHESMIGEAFIDV